VTAEKPKGTAALREMLLRSKPSDFGLAPTTDLPHVWAAMMEMQFRDATASLVVVKGGATSLYFSTGGGVIGGETHESVREANRKFLAAIERFFDAKAFVPQTSALATMKDAVTFNVLVYEGLVAARDTEERMKTRKSPLWPLYFLGQDVITQLRVTAEKKSGA